MKIRKMRQQDIYMVMQIEKASFKNGRYTKEQMLYELNENPFTTFLVVEDDVEEIVGYLVYMVTFNSATIVKIAIFPFYRRTNIGTSLLNAMFKDLSSKGYGVIETVTLEVRITNEIAHQFYLKNGFKDVVIKKAYYSNGDDAIYMSKVLL